MDSRATPAFPVAQHGHDRGCSAAGGYVRRGARAPALRGRYLFADDGGGRVWSLGAGARPGGLHEETGRRGVSLSRVTSFEEGLNGDAWVIGDDLSALAPRTP